MTLAVTITALHCRPWGSYTVSSLDASPIDDATSDDARDEGADDATIEPARDVENGTDARDEGADDATTEPTRDPRDTCPGVPLRFDAPNSIDWSSLRAGLELGTSCGMTPAETGRDAVFSFTLPVRSSVRLRFETAPSNLHIQPYRACDPEQRTPFCTSSNDIEYQTVRLSAGLHFMLFEHAPTLPSVTRFSADYNGSSPPSSWTYQSATDLSVGFQDICDERGATRFPFPVQGGFSASIPFPLRVFDIETYGDPRVTIYSNGYLSIFRSITSNPPSSLMSDFFGDGTVSVFGAASEWATENNNICRITRGMAPNRQHVIQWSPRRLLSAPTSLITAQIILHEAPEGSPNRVDFVYGSLENIATEDLLVGLRGLPSEVVWTSTIGTRSARIFSPHRP